MKTPGEILSKTAIAGQPLLSSETLKSLDPNLSEIESEKRQPTPKLPRGPGVFNPEFRKALLQLDEGHHPKVQEMAIAAEWYVRALSVKDLSRGRGIVFSGAPGCGKTKAARGIYKFARSFGADIIESHKISHWATLWIDWPNVAESDDEDDFKDARQQLEQATFVVLDDVGSETDRFKTGLPTSRFRRVLSIIEQAKIWTVITSNLDKTKLLERYDARNSDRIDAFQWMEMGSVPSYRPKLIG